MDCKKLLLAKEIEGEGHNEFVAQIAKKTLSYLAKHKIPITPTNYQEWFFVICKALTENHHLSDKNLQILHDKYFKEDPLIEDIEEIKELSVSLKSLAQGSEKALDKFEDNITAHSSYIDESIEAIDEQDKSKMAQLKDKIAHLEAENQKLKKFLEQNRKKLEFIEEKFVKQKQEAERDALTGLLNRRAFDIDIEKLHELNASYSILILDIDNFKKINDTYGHLVGDEILKVMGEILENYLRQNTKAYRYGGEEFVILLPNGDFKAAKIVGERLRDVIENRDYKVEQNGYIHFTASFGGTQRQEGDSVKDVIKRADEALYQAKKEGKNRVVIK
ncbi:GGDEF domain-containing protein [Nitratiruptor sp. YY09-18]|uniref:GGDEF domain-containing protein n=1 Tax=Nitratiruptor sp. YY09-18 TaxID=2724901 RepID=UPI00191517AB|nr:GGDEF domain-containing protein [Nitratiruptor sp. YY09-18]BCD68636.1 diguanylate cyclase/phosphodiesterase [Nitratiruptor sp. YY09-18]